MKLISSYGVLVNVADELADFFVKNHGFSRAGATKAPAGVPADDKQEAPKPRAPRRKKTDTDD